MMILLTTGWAEKQMVRNGEKKGEQTVLWDLHRKWVSCNVEFCMETVQRAKSTTVLLSTVVVALALCGTGTSSTTLCTSNHCSTEYYCGRLCAVHIRVPNQPKTDTLHLFMPLKHQQHTQIWWSYLQQYDQKTNDAKWREESEKQFCGCCTKNRCHARWGVCMLPVHLSRTVLWKCAGIGIDQWDGTGIQCIVHQYSYCRKNLHY